MKLERTIFKMSILDTIILSTFFLVVLNAAILLFSVLIGRQGFFIKDSGWLSQIVFPVLYSIIQTSINRNAELKLTEFANSETLTRQIELLLLKKGYVVIDSNTDNIKYDKRTKWSRFFNYFFKENINVRISESRVSIYAKKHLLDSIEMKLKYGKTNG